MYLTIRPLPDFIKYLGIPSNNLDFALPMIKPFLEMIYGSGEKFAKGHVVVERSGSSTLLLE
ncbi:MAG: hypothetical protein SCALA701_12620 [Candidatus Scalindua sp.]|nr:MAG: hypothetical protein DWQ00_09835 [Candidatus Scalindua sp.]GJQ58461.1 MAG: hypothetical protein SCALA701_12620 [Candidatus Scalindua sp.]